MTSLKTSLKVFHNHKFYTGINIFGLSVGFAFILLIGLVLNYDLGFDKHWQNSESIFRIDYHYSQNESEDQLALCSKFLPERLQAGIPEIIGAARFSSPRNLTVKIKEQFYKEDAIIYSDQKSLELFELEIITGSLEGLLAQPGQILISDVLARKWFTSADAAIGEIIQVRGQTYQIQSVFSPIKHNSHLQFDGLMSYASLFQRDKTDEQNGSILSNLWVPDAIGYVKLADSRQIESVRAKGQSFIDEVVQPVIRKEGIEEQLELLFIPLEQSHFYTESSFDQVNGNISFMKMIGIIGIIIALIIIINYANLSMAILTQRSKEFSMRKILGASRRSLITLIFIESAICVLISFSMAFLWLLILDSSLQIETIFDRVISISDLFDAKILLLSLLGLFIIVVLSSWYPAIAYSKPNIVDQRNSKISNRGLKNALIGVQFFATFIVITSMILMNRQLSMINSFDLGITDAPVLSIEIGENSSPEQIKMVKTELSQFPEIENVSDAILNGKELLGLYHINTQIEINGSQKVEKVFVSSFVGQEYCEMLDIDLIEGRNLQVNSALMKEVLVNESFKEQYIQSSVLNEPIHWGNRTFKIIGVVEDFHIKSLRSEIEPMIIFPRQTFTQNLDDPLNTSYHLKLASGQTQSAIRKAEAAFTKVYPEFPFGYTFLSDKIKSFYIKDKRDSQFVAILGLSVCIIAIFGLLGLVSFELNERKKELCTRKVLGANSKNLLFSISNRQLVYLIISCIASIPVTYYFINDWLNEFSYQINLATNLILAALMSFLLIGFLVGLAMISKYYEIERLNPADILRQE